MEFGKSLTKVVESYLNNTEKTRYAWIMCSFDASLIIYLAAFLINMYGFKVNRSETLLLSSEYPTEYIKKIEEWLDLFEGHLWTAFLDETVHRDDAHALWIVTRI